MCNLYSVSKGQAAIRDWFRVAQDLTGNLPPMPGIFPDYAAPVVRIINGERTLTMKRWGMPSPVFALKGRTTDPGVTNVRNVKSPHWRRWTGEASRCVVPFTSFSEYETTPEGKKSPVWFALDEGRPLAAFAGTNWTCIRKTKEGEITCDLFAFLTCDANAVIAPIHPKAMPAILTTEEEVDAWLRAPWPEACALQRPPARLFAPDRRSRGTAGRGACARQPRSRDGALIRLEVSHRARFHSISGGDNRAGASGTGFSGERPRRLQWSRRGR